MIATLTEAAADLAMAYVVLVHHMIGVGLGLRLGSLTGGYFGHLPRPRSVHLKKHVPMVCMWSTVETGSNPA